MIELLVGVAGVLVAILALLSFLAKSKKESNAEENAPRGIPNAARERGNAGARAMPAGARRRRGMRGAAAGRPADESDDDDDANFGAGRGGGGGGTGGGGRGGRADVDEDEVDDDLLDYVNLPDGKIGAKKMRKLEEKAEKRRMREMEIEEREERKQREEQLEEERKKEEAKKEAIEAAKEEEERKRKEEEEAREYEEYLKLKAEFAVEEEGEAQVATEEESQALLQQFVDFIRQQKVVLMEDLASHFSLRTQEAIQRVQDLQAMGRLTGVIDDRGKFIHISTEEMQEVAKFIRLHGRISIADLAAASSSLVNLTPQTELLTLES